ncbi:MAG TPA: pilus assembly protein TadG-related protein [Methylomirabilota bacterium]|nr:pilus assembly protein TadG-related protein [Methylomirabilota bacterium]
MFRRNSSYDSSESGQVLIIFAFAFIAIIMTLALLFDGARGLVLRRQLQDASDAAALAGANVIQGLSPQQCSLTVGPPLGAPVAAVTAAAKASVAANLPQYPQANVLVTCVAGYDNYAVKVHLAANSPTFFGQIFGGGPLSLQTDSSAVNGNTNINAYSVVMLDPMNLAWPNGQRGCPSFLLSGGPTVIFDSSIYIDSACTAANGGAMSTNGNSASLTQGSGSTIRIVGEYKPQALVITPPPLNYQPYKPDPLAWLVAPPVSTLKVQSNNKLIIGQGQSSSTVILEPGVYKGGIQLKNQSIAYLHPGIYVMDGGGFQIGAGQKVYAIPANKSNTTDATWATDCLTTNCGILLYNTGTAANGTGQLSQVSIGAQSTFKVRSYNNTFDTTKLASGAAYSNSTYKNLLIWQSAAPIPTSSYVQPLMALTGGGNVFMQGTIYAPSAKIQMGGNSGGSGGDSVDLTLQFISWDLELYGNSSFRFRYNAAQFARLLDYGLIE